MGAALLRAPRRIAVAVSAMVVLTAAFVLAFDAARPDYVQGRYVLPFAAGIPLLSGLGLAESGVRIRRGALAGLLAILAAAQFGAFYVTLRRFSVGAQGPSWFLTEANWNPPLAPAGAMLVANAVVAAALVVSILRVTPTRSPGTGVADRPERALEGTPTALRAGAGPDEVDWLAEGLLAGKRHEDAVDSDPDPHPRP